MDRRRLLTRRQLLEQAGIAGVAGIAGSSVLLQACTPASAPAGATATASAAPQASAAAGPKAIDVVRLGTVFAIPHFDFLEASVGASQNYDMVGYHIYDQLLTLDPKTERGYTPMLGTSFDFSSDGLTMRVKLREGVSFHDGSPFTSEDVKFTWDKWLDPKNTAGALADVRNYVASVDIVDKYTVNFRLKYNSPIFWERHIGGARVFSKAHYEKYGRAGNAERPNGTGPYRLADFQVNTKMILDANPSYWGPKPLAKRLDVRFATDERARVNMLKGGEVDFIDNIGVESLRSLGSEFQTFTQGEGHATRIRLNTRPPHEKSPWSDLRVRKALNHAVDRATINSTIFEGKATNVPAYYAPISLGYNKELKPYAYDVALAKRLMAEAGFADGFATEITFPQGRYTQGPEVIAAVAGYWREIGVRAALKPVDIAAWNAAFRSTDAATRPPMIQMSAASANNEDPLTTLTQILPSTSGLSGFHDPEINDMLLNKIPKITDVAERVKQCQAVEKLAYDKAYDVYLNEAPQIWAARKTIHWTPYPRFIIWTGWLMGAK